MKLKKVLAGIMAVVTAVTASVCGLSVSAGAVSEKITYQGYAYDMESIPLVYIYNNLDKIYGQGNVPDIECSSWGLDHNKPIVLDESKADQLIVENIQPTDKITLHPISAGKGDNLYITFYTVNYNSPQLYSYSIPDHIYGTMKTGTTLQKMIDQYNEDLDNLRSLSEFKSVEKLSYNNIGGIRVWNGNSDIGSFTWELIIEPGSKSSVKESSTNISSLKLGKISTKTYTGKAIKPSITIKDCSKKLVSGTDYTVTYKNNTKPGKATATITGKGDYTGTKTVTFNIAPKKVKLSAKTSGAGAVLSWKKSTGATGYEIYYSTNGGKFRKLTTVKSAKYTAELTSGSAYKFRVRPYVNINGKKVYGKWSNTVSCK